MRQPEKFSRLTSAEILPEAKIKCYARFFQTAIFRMLSANSFNKKKSSARLLSLVICAGLIAVLPVLFGGLPFFSHDGAVHAVWYSNFARQFWAGEFYPRWLAGMNEGLGSPTFFYYPPLAYYLTVPFYFLSKTDASGWRQLGFAASIAQIASGVCAYLWLKNIAQRHAAAIAAAIYVWMPYHLAFDLYRRAALAEIWTFVWLPLVLHFTHKICAERKNAFLGFAVCYALLVMTHLPITLIFSPLPLSYALFLSKKQSRIKNLFFVAGAMLLGTGLSAVYLLPALTMQEATHVGEIATGFMYYEKWFLVTHLQPWGSEAIYFWTVVVMATLAICSFSICRRASLNNKDAVQTRLREAKFWLAGVAVCIFMMCPLSKPIYELLPVLQKIQFPWRFNVVLCVQVAALLALALPAIEKPYFAVLKKTKILVLVLVFFSIPYAAAQAWRAYPLTRSMPKDVGDIERRLRQNRDQPEYRTIWTATPLEEEKNLLALLSDIGRTINGEIIPFKIVEGAGAVTILERKPREIRLRVEASENMKFNLSQFYFPNWTAEGDAEINVEPSVPNGLMSVSAPAGNHDFTLRLQENEAERSGKIVSLASLILLFAAMGIFYRRAQIGS